MTLYIVVAVGLSVALFGALYERYIGRPRRLDRVLREWNKQWLTTNSGPTSR
jgi:hypothetical protein